MTQSSLPEGYPDGQSQDHSDGLFSDDKEPSLPNVNHLWHFLLDGNPLLKLREDLETFIEAAKVGHVDGVGEVEETTGSCEKSIAPRGEQDSPDCHAVFHAVSEEATPEQEAMSSLSTESKASNTHSSAM